MHSTLSNPLSRPLSALATALLGMALLSCDQELISSADQPRVDYVLVVTDSSTSAPLDSVRVRVTTIDGGTSTYFTDRMEGRVELGTVTSSRTLFILSKSGYRTLDLIDTVDSEPDTVFNRPVQRLLRARMANLEPGLGRVQVQVLMRGPDLQKLRRGMVTFTDSSGTEFTAIDGDSDGTVGLTGLGLGKSQVRVEHASYLGRLVEVNVERGADTGRAPMVTVVLMDMKNSISGQVYASTASGSKALLDAKVEFHLKDTSAYPRIFRTFTSADAGQDGRFVFPEVPAVDGELWYFKDRSSVERVKYTALTKEEVMLEGPMPLVILAIRSDSLLPLLISGPGKTLPGKDTVGARDSLVFKFTQGVAQILSLKVRVINGSELLIGSSWNGDKTLLKVWQKDAAWIEGKKYEYEIALANDRGETFSVPGDSSSVVSGSFMVRVPVDGVDSTLLFPRDIRFAYFNSGGFHRFAASDTNTSPKADSSSQFARLKMRWDAGKGRRVDSLVIFYRDGVSEVNWTRWGSVPGFLDSADLSFSDHYSTFQVPGDKARFPLRDSLGEILFRIIPKHGGRSIEEADTTLEAISQGMGPTVYVHYQNKDSLKATPGSKDSLEVTFRGNLSDAGSERSWGGEGTRPVPRLFLNGSEAPTGFSWRWISDKKGLLVYTLPGTLTSVTRLRVDLGGILFQGKPVWQRNFKDEKILP